MKHVVVLGATGTLGLPICRYLNDKGCQVFAVGHSQNGKKLFTELGIPYAALDIAEKSGFDALPQENVDCVINFAGALPAMMRAEDDNTMYPDTIIRGTINVLDYMRRVGCRQLIFPQSVYDVHYLFGTPEPISADAERRTVHEGDHCIYQYHPKPFILINGNMRVKSERILIHKAKKGETLEIWGDPKRVLESVCMEDFLQIVEKCVFSETARGIYNVGSGGSTLEERVLGIRDVFCPQDNISEIVYCPEKKNCTQYVLDIRKTMTELGYVPQYSWTDYLKKLKWHMENQPNCSVWGTFEEYDNLLE